MAGKNVTECLYADDAGCARAAAILASGGLVALPTETVYGLAARADDAGAVARIYQAKGRPDFNPLIVHVRDGAQAQQYAHLPPAAHQLMESFWPGPLTLVLPKRADAQLAPAVTAGLPSVALRAPAHPLIRQILARVDFPLAAPSANASGSISPTEAGHVISTLDGRIDAVLDGGRTEQGLESTIVALREDGGATGWEILRPGPIDEAAIAALIGPSMRGAQHPSPPGKVEAPGQLTRHYSPGKPIRLNAQGAHAGEFMIGFGNIGGDCSLSPSGNLDEAAANLYRCLHLARVSAAGAIAIAPIPTMGVGIAINDRLKRAAA